MIEYLRVFGHAGFFCSCRIAIRRVESRSYAAGVMRIDASSKTYIRNDIGPTSRPYPRQQTINKSEIIIYLKESRT